MRVSRKRSKDTKAFSNPLERSLSDDAENDPTASGTFDTDAGVSSHERSSTAPKIDLERITFDDEGGDLTSRAHGRTW
jgi:hypothetical protein